MKKGIAWLLAVVLLIGLLHILLMIRLLHILLLIFSLTCHLLLIVWINRLLHILLLRKSRRLLHICLLLILLLRKCIGIVLLWLSSRLFRLNRLCISCGNLLRLIRVITSAEIKAGKEFFRNILLILSGSNIFFFNS